jgi:hypothetical protein
MIHKSLFGSDIYVAVTVCYVSKGTRKLIVSLYEPATTDKEVQRRHALCPYLILFAFPLYCDIAKKIAKNSPTIGGKRMNVSCRRFYASMATKNVSLFKVPHNPQHAKSICTTCAHSCTKMHLLFLIMSFVKKIKVF